MSDNEKLAGQIALVTAAGIVNMASKLGYLGVPLLI